MTSINIDCRRKKITHKSKQNKIKPSTAVFFSRGKIYFKKEKKKKCSPAKSCRRFLFINTGRNKNTELLLSHENPKTGEEGTKLIRNLRNVINFND